MKPVKLGPFKGGINNVVPDHSLPADPAHGVYYLRDAVNVDITNSGTIKRRGGYDQVVPATLLRSAWSNGTEGFVIDNGQLKRLTQDADGNLEVQNIDDDSDVPANLTYGAEFCQTPTHTVLSDRNKLYYVHNDTLYDYTLESPTPTNSVQPEVGHRLVCTTTVMDDGSESAPSRIVWVSSDVVELPALVRTTNIYASNVGGTELYRVTAVNSGPVSLPTTPITGRMLDKSNLDYMPAGTILRVGFGRLWSVSGNALFYSEPFRYNMTDMSKNIMMFEDDITLFEVLNNGYLVGTKTQLFILNGADFNQMQLTNILQVGAVPGSCQSDGVSGYVFMTELGAYKCSLSGEVEAIHLGKVGVEKAQRGSSGVVVEDGVRKALMSLFDKQFSGSVARSFMDAEVIRKETSL